MCGENCCCGGNCGCHNLEKLKKKSGEEESRLEEEAE